MIKSLYSGVSGLRAHQTKMDVIGNNIANVNTTAFKSSRVTFQDVYYQTVSGATPNTETKGGINAKQIGFGATVSSIDVINTRGGIQSTDRPLDLYLSGEGYFVVTDGAGIVNYTRAGNFRFDVQGALVDPNGNYVVGWQPEYESGDMPAPVVIPNINDYTNITIGNDGRITGVYSGSAPLHIPNSYEDLWNLNELSFPGYSDIKFVDGKIIGDDVATGATEVELFGNIKINSDGSITGDSLLDGTISVVLGSVSDFLSNPADYTDYIIYADGTVSAMFKGHFTNETESLGSINGPSLQIPGYTDVEYSNGTIRGIDSATGELTVLYTNVTMNEAGIFTADNAVSGATGEVLPFLGLGNLVADVSLYSNLTLNEDGTVTGIYNSTQVPEHIPNDIEVLGQIAVAKFSNPDALMQKDGIYFQESRNSGVPIITFPGDNATATIVSGGLEMSNVDLSREFTDMITTQRGFQANSRLITTSDQLLEELVNLKR